MKRSAYEIYSNLLKDVAQSGDEESEDSDDEEFGAGQLHIRPLKQ